MGSVDDVTVIFGVKLGLSAEFTTKKLGRVCREEGDISGCGGEALVCSSCSDYIKDSAGLYQTAPCSETFDLRLQPLHRVQFTTPAQTNTATLTCWRPVQSLGNINHVDNDRLDSIPFAFNLDEEKPENRRSVPPLLQQLSKY